MKKKDDKQSIAIKKSDQTKEKVGTNELTKYSGFRVSSKRKKCPPRVGTAAGKRQRAATGKVGSLSGHMAKGRFVSNECKILILEIHFVRNSIVKNRETFTIKRMLWLFSLNIVFFLFSFFFLSKNAKVEINVNAEWTCLSLIRASSLVNCKHWYHCRPPSR